VASFEQRLWDELVERHGALLADAPLPATSLPAPAAETRVRARSRRRRLPLAVAVGIALAAALAAIVIGLASRSTTPPAYAVVRNPNGTVTVTVRELAGVTGADAKLRALGLPVRVVRAYAGCTTRSGAYPRAPLTPEQEAALGVPGRAPDGAASLLIDPAAIPAGDTVVIGAYSLSESPSKPVVGLEITVYVGTATPSCLPTPGTP